jgi:PAS domain S-box-containing protein
MKNRPFGKGTRTIYYLLAAFTLLTILVSAYLNNHLGVSERRTLEENERAATHVARISDVELAAAAVDSARDELFAGADLPGERAALLSAAAVFRQTMHAARDSAGDEPDALREMGEADHRMSLILRHADDAVRLYGLGDSARAGASIVTLDREYGALRTDLAEAKQFLRVQQIADFRQQTLNSIQLERQQTTSIALMAVLVVGLVAYGRRLNQEVFTSGELERSVQTLQEGREALRLALAERDERSAELTHNQELLSEAQRIAHLGAWEWVISTGQVWWSAEMYRLFAIDPEKVKASFEAFIANVDPADRERVAGRIAQAGDDHQSFEQEYRFLLPGGEHRIHHSAVRVDVDAAGTAVRMFGVTQDVTERKRDEEQLLQQEAQLAEAQRLARLGSWELDIRTQRVTWSQELHAVLGYEPGEVTPSFKAYMTLLSEKEKRRVYGLLEKALATGERFEFQHSLTRRDGAELSVFVQGLVTRDAQGEPLRVLGVCQDLTERKKAEQDLRLSEERFQLASRATDDIIWDTDLVGNKVWVNESFASRLGYPAWGDVDIAAWADALHPADAERVLSTVGNVIASDATAMNIQYRFGAFGGGWRDVLFRGHVVRGTNGKAVRIIGAMMDITERRVIDRMKDEFISTVSHELRTPLTSIRGALGLLSSGRLGTLAEKGQRLLEIASSNTDRLVRLINDILDIERIESGNVTLTKTNCEADTLARAAADVVRALADRENIRITIEAEPAPLVADSDRMVQTLTNLLGNAVKFSPAGSIIRLTARSEGTNVVFSVVDQGRGIPSDKLGTIFERFQQVDASDSRDKGGSGLGLTICRSIVRQHGGEIRVESEPGTGSTFTVTVPSGISADAGQEGSISDAA